ncbi:MAG: hypothetical protein IKJ83_02045, partial [Ruminococcus sp.]|nr:hypothetical protein [Ruminococcus sp.]
LVILCSALMPIMLFFANVGAVKFYEIAVFIGIYSFIGLAVFTVLRLIMKSEYKAGIAAGFFSLIFQNAGRLTTLMSYKFVLVIFLLVIATLIFAIWKFLKDDIAKLFVPVLSAVLTMLLIMNTVMSIGKIASVANADKETQEDINKQYEYLVSFKDESKTPEEIPNVYFIIPDEYAGFKSLEKFYGYDNAEFKNFLESHNFSVSENSTNYYDGTLECLANVFNLEFSKKNRYGVSSEGYCDNKVSNGVIFRLAEETGYTVNVAQTTKLTPYESKTEIYGDKWSSTGDSKSTIDLMVAPSMLSPFTDKIRSVLNGVPLDYFEGRSHIVHQAQSFIDPLLYFAESENVGKDCTFNLCYASIPHQPFFFDSKGILIEDLSHFNDWGDKSYYLNQLKYCTTLLEKTIENIIENDPNSVIILMSDHGARNHYSGEPELEWMNEMSAKDNTDILCAVYYKGEEFTDIEGMCGSNVLISVVNKAWGYSIPLIEQSDDMYYKPIN